MTELPIPVSGPVALADDDDWDAWRPTVVDAAVTVIEVAADDIDNAAALFENFAAAMNLPDDAPIRTWSGLQDRLWEFLAQQEGDQAVIVLRRVDGFLTSGLGDLLNLVSTFEELARATADPEAGIGRELTVTAILTGFGRNFPVR